MSQSIQLDVTSTAVDSLKESLQGYLDEGKKTLEDFWLRIYYRGFG